MPLAWADRLGIGASALCVVHCAVTPILISFSSVLAQILPSEKSAHRSLSVVVAALGAIALLRGFRAHRRVRVLLIMTAGLACIGGAAWWGTLLPRHWMEVAITCVGSAFLISAHRMNHTFCRDCVCAGHAGHSTSE